MMNARKAVRMAPVGKQAGWAENPPRVMISRDETPTTRFSMGYNQRVDSTGSSSIDEMRCRATFQRFTRRAIYRQL